MQWLLELAVPTASGIIGAALAFVALRERTVRLEVRLDVVEKKVAPIEQMMRLLVVMRRDLQYLRKSVSHNHTSQPNP